MTDKKRVKFPVDPARVDRKNAGGLFVYGPTKCAVILRDMAVTLDAEGFGVSKPLGRAFAKVDEMLDLVTRRYVETQASRRKNLLNEHDISGFKEHLVQFVARVEGDLLSGKVPASVREMFRTVAKERINISKVRLGIAQAKAGADYTTRDLIEWTNSDVVAAARERWYIDVMRERPKSQYSWYS